MGGGDTGARQGNARAGGSQAPAKWDLAQPGWRRDPSSAIKRFKRVGLARARRMADGGWRNASCARGVGRWEQTSPPSGPSHLRSRPLQPPPPPSPSTRAVPSIAARPPNTLSLFFSLAPTQHRYPRPYRPRPGPARVDGRLGRLGRLGRPPTGKSAPPPLGTKVGPFVNLRQAPPPLADPTQGTLPAGRARDPPSRFRTVPGLARRPLTPWDNQGPTTTLGGGGEANRTSAASSEPASPLPAPIGNEWVGVRDGEIFWSMEFPSAPHASWCFPSALFGRFPSTPPPFRGADGMGSSM